MGFTDHVTFVNVAGEQVPVRVTADALRPFWGSGIAPQDGARLVGNNNETIGSIVSEKVVADEWEDGEIVIRAMDIER